MKTARKILPALAMLIVSAVMMSTASFAWFAMSTSVTVDNVSIGVTSDSSYLLILDKADPSLADADGEAAILAAIYSGGNTAIDYNEVEKTDLLPVAFKETAATTGLITYFSTPGSWYYMTASDPSASTGDTGSETDLTTDNFDDYVLAKSFYLAVDKGSNAMTDLKVELTTATVDEAVRVLVVVDGVHTVLSNASKTSNVDLGDLAVNSYTQVDVYYYYDGNDSTVNTDNLGTGSIADAVVSIKFSATVSNAAN